MTPDKIMLVKQSFALVVPISEQAADIFYGRLFEIAPDTRPLFKNDIKEQGRKLMATLGVAVSSLDRLDQILPTVKELAVKHEGYGVKPEHYDNVGEALLWTLEKGLGDKFTPAHHEAWGEVYTTLSQVMRDATEQASTITKTG